MAQLILIGAGTTARLSAAITLALGEAMPVSATVPLSGGEQVYLMHSSDDGATFVRTQGATNNHGIILDAATNRATLVGDGDSAPFKIGITDTLGSTAVKGG